MPQELHKRPGGDPFLDTSNTNTVDRQPPLLPLELSLARFESSDTRSPVSSKLYIISFSLKVSAAFAGLSDSLFVSGSLLY